MKLVESMLENSNFKEFFVADLMERGMVSVRKVLEDEDFDITELTVRNVNEMMGSDRALNPLVMNIMVKHLLESESKTIGEGSSAQFYLSLFNFVLSQMILFCSDFDSCIVDKLMKTCNNIL